MLCVLFGLDYGGEIGGIEVEVPTEARIFSSAKFKTGSSANTSPTSRVRDSFSSGLMRPSRGAAQILTSCEVYRK